LFREIIDFKSPFTAAHSSGVSACAGKLANLYGFTATDCELMKIAGNLHDIGKMAIPNAILEKSGKLTPAEFAIVKSHTYYTYHVLKPLAPISQIAEWAAYHHEKLDGSGYPFHRHSGELDFGSRIMAVADIYTAIAEERPYRSGMSHNQIYQVLKNAAVHQYIDSEIVALLLDNYHIVSEHVRERQTTARSFYHNSFCRPEDPGRNS
jgi:HD-GYP domain-containing protein (c-di-GMP phosphodiesterase class II)